MTQGVSLGCAPTPTPTSPTVSPKARASARRRAELATPTADRLHPIHLRTLLHRFLHRFLNRGLCVFGLFHGFLTVPTLSHTQPARERLWAMLREAMQIT